MNQGFMKMDTLVMSLLASNRLTTLHKYVWFLHYLLEGYKKHIMSTIPITKSVCLPVSKTKTIQYPKDYIGLIRIGVRNGDRIVRFMPDQTISRSTQDDKAYKPSEMQDRRYSYQYFNNIYDYESEPYKGMGDNQTGYYVDNLAAKCFELSVDAKLNIGDTVFLEYVADGFNMDTETQIYAPSAEFLKAFAMWQWNLYQLGAQAGKTEGWRITYLRELAEYKAITSNLDRDVILNAISRTASVAPRY
jgi:hypothetical protein